MLKSNGKFGFVPDPPEIIECKAENYDKDNCRFCANEKECWKEWKEHEHTRDS